MEMILLLCLATEPDCNVQTATQVIRVQMQQLTINCAYQAESYIVQNGIELAGLKMNAKCRL